MKEIFEQIQNLNKPAIVGISGFGGSGKSTLAQLIGNHFNLQPIGVDEFWQDTTMEDYHLWNVVDFNRLEEQVLKPFTQGKNTILYRALNWETNSSDVEKTVSHNGLLVVEGVGLFRPNLMDYFSHTIWIDCPLEKAIERGKKRDREEYHHPQDEKWDGIWKENDIEYFEKYKPNEMADSVVHSTGI